LNAWVSSAVINPANMYTLEHPTDRSQTFELSLPHHEWSDLEELAVRFGVSVDAVIGMALREMDETKILCACSL
jgi:hypothetical protein